MDDDEAMRGVFGDSSRSSSSKFINTNHAEKSSINDTTSMKNGIEEFWIE